MKAKRVMIAAVKSGSGKTLITCSLLAAFKKRQIAVSAFKCGPDYIDPMFHQTIIGVPSRNLDPFFSKPEQLARLFLRDQRPEQVSVLEGAMGLYDGLGGIRQEGSAYQVASALQTPILLVVDAHGMGRSVIPLLFGLLSYDTQGLIRGVILNRVSASFYQTIAPVIEKELSLPVLGYFPVQKGLHLESRHLGLVMPHEIQDLKEQVEAAGEVLAKTVNLDKILEIAAGAEELTVFEKQEAFGKRPSVTIGVARDEAFCFYYEDNLQVLKEAGARLVFFSPLHDAELPEGLDGLLLGGGYPELYAAALEANETMRQSIRKALEGGMPSVAECGGFMYLHERLRDKEEKEHRMCGVIPAECYNTGKLSRFGYITITEKEPCFLPPGEAVLGHEFHYYDSTQNGDCCRAKKPVTEKSWDCIHTAKNHWWGFAHLYYPSSPAFATCFLEQVFSYQKQRLFRQLQKHG